MKKKRQGRWKERELRETRQNCGLPDEQKLTVEFLITQIAWIAPVSRREA